MPSLNEIVFLSAAGRLSRGVVMGMEMGRAIRDGVRHLDMSLEPLMQIPGLSNVDRRPITVRQLLGIDVIAGQGPKRSVKAINLVMIFLAGLPGPTVGGGCRCALRMRVTTE